MGKRSQLTIHQGWQQISTSKDVKHHQPLREFKLELTGIPLHTSEGTKFKRSSVETMGDKCE